MLLIFLPSWSLASTRCPQVGRHHQSLTTPQRNLFPAAVQKDKHSRSGLVKSETQRKQGAGAHNWGSFHQEGEYESMANTDAADERAMFEMEQERQDGVPALKKPAGTDPLLNGNGHASTDVEGNKDIAHSPSDSMSSLDSAGAAAKGPGMQRRMSNVSDEERERASIYREGVMKKGRKSHPPSPLFSCGV